MDRDKAPQNPNQFTSKKAIERAFSKDANLRGKYVEKQEREYDRNFNKWREYDLLACLIALVGLALSIVDWEYTWKQAENISH